MESLKGTESLFMIIISLLSRAIDIPNYSELVKAPEKKKSGDESSSSDDNSLIRRNVIFDIASAAKNLFQNNEEELTGDSEVLFGKPLSKELPTKLRKLIVFINQNSFQEGLFRKCGSNKRMKDIRNLLDSHGNMIDWCNQSDFTAHDAASVLKQYISELPKPLLCPKLIPIHLEISKLTDKEKKLKCVQLVLLLLPEQNRMFFKVLMVLLSEVASNKDSLMDSHNLGLIFAPHLFKSKQMDSATNLCLGNATMSDQLDDIVTYTSYLVDNSETLFQVPHELNDVANRYTARLKRGESCDDIPVEITSSCVRVERDLHKQVVTDSTKHQLIQLYKTFQAMPDSKDKFSRIKKFEKQYPHYIMELNNVSHSPMIRTKSTRKQIGNTLSRLLHVKSSTPSAPFSTPSAPSTSEACFSPRPVTDTSTPNTTPVVNGGHKRKVFEMLQSSQYTSLSSFIEPVSMEATDPDEQPPRYVRRRLNDYLDDQPSSEDMKDNEDNEDEVQMDYREIGDTYREYFV